MPGAADTITADAMAGVPVWAYGHSFVEGTSQQRNPWVARLPRLTGCATVTNRGIGGNCIAQTMNNFHAGYGATGWTSNTRGLVIFETMINDARLLGLSGVATWKKQATLLALVARSAAYAEQTTGTFGGGSWFAQAAAQNLARGGTIGLATTPGNYVEFTVSGYTEYALVVGQLKSGFSSGASYSVTVDGSAHSTGSQATGSDGPPAANTQNYALVPHRLTGLSTASHTIRITHTGGSGDQMYVDGIYSISSSAPPTVLFVGDPYLANWTTNSPYNVGSDAAADAYLTAAAEVAALFPAGHVVVADARVGWDAATMLGADGVHPNDRGAGHIAGVVAKVMRRLDYRAGLHV